MVSPYDPQQYWEDRLKKRFDLSGVGHIGFTKRYNGWLYQRKRRCIELALHDVPLKGKDVLDIGCGTGFFVKWYLERGAFVCGIDITATSVQILSELYPCEFHRQDIAAVDYQASKKFDIVNMWDVIYHVVSPESFMQAVGNISESLKVGGLLLLTDWFGLTHDTRIADHVMARCLETYQRILPKNGLHLLRTYPLYKLLDKNNVGPLDNNLGWLYFFLDNFQTKIPADNLSLSVWRRIPIGAS
jgi:2-polyprenyl-3-methyl-5-hydroxy-6-metoxy-1,4-benzoquinol methylase